MRVLLRADAGAAIGAGHLARCVALAEEAVRRRHPVVLCGEVGGAGWLARRLDELGVPVVPATGPLGAQVRELAADVVVVDHYSLGGDLRGEVNAAGATLVSIEDGPFGRRAADVVVDANLTSRARPEDGTPVVVRGPRFAPLREAVLAARARRAAGVPVGDVARVVVVLGGSSAGKAVSAVLTALAGTGHRLEVEAISASGGVDVPATAAHQRITVHPPRPDLPELLAGADLVVSAAGVTLLELCCLGVPMALLRLADNQAAGYRAAVERGLAVGLGDAGALVAKPSGAVETLRALIADRERLARLGALAAATVDGRGARRILDAVRGK